LSSQLFLAEDEEQYDSMQPYWGQRLAGTIVAYVFKSSHQRIWRNYRFYYR
jgi:hypothetical protein